VRETVSYSEAFKRGVVEKVAQGKYASLAEASRRNGIKGSETLVRWIKKYGREAPRTRSRNRLYNEASNRRFYLFPDNGN
jgi:transposase-like protein